MVAFFQLEQEPIRITARGQWLHGSDPITARVAKLFAHHVVVQDDGTYAIRLGRQQQTIAADDTPFAVVRLQEDHQQKDRAGHLILHTSDGRQEQLDPATLMQSADNVLYCRIIRDGFSVPCRFQPGQYHDLALMAEERSDGFCLPIGGKNYPIAHYDSRPHKSF